MKASDIHEASRLLNELKTMKYALANFYAGAEVRLTVNRVVPETFATVTKLESGIDSPLLNEIRIKFETERKQLEKRLAELGVNIDEAD